LESNLQKKIIKSLTKSGWYVVKIVMSNTAGIPDIWAGRAGKCIWIECKDKDEEAEPLQLHRHQELKAKGFQVFVIDSWELYQELKAKF
jgi:Holliday junction resolvase